MRLLSSTELGPLLCEVCDEPASYLVDLEAEAGIEVCEGCVLEALELFPSDAQIKAGKLPM